jgi:hypothetical protein
MAYADGIVKVRMFIHRTAEHGHRIGVIDENHIGGVFLHGPANFHKDGNRPECRHHGRGAGGVADNLVDAVPGADEQVFHVRPARAMESASCRALSSNACEGKIRTLDGSSEIRRCANLEPNPGFIRNPLGAGRHEFEPLGIDIVQVDAASAQALAPGEVREHDSEIPRCSAQEYYLFSHSESLQDYKSLAQSIDCKGNGKIPSLQYVSPSGARRRLFLHEKTLSSGFNAYLPLPYSSAASRNARMFW